MSIGEEIYDEYMADRIWPGTRDLAQAHLDAGQKVWLVTAAPVETATIIARRLGLTGALGTVAESVDGVYTGRLVGEPLHGPAKAEAVRALASAEGLDLSRCAAYSDSHNDIPMLSLVGHPYAINPDTKLRKHAKARDWRLRDYRTGRKAAKVGIPAAAGLGALAAWHGGRGRPPPPPPLSPGRPPGPRPSPSGPGPALLPRCAGTICRYVSAAIICDNPGPSALTRPCSNTTAQVDPQAFRAPYPAAAPITHRSCT